MLSISSSKQLQPKARTVHKERRKRQQRDMTMRNPVRYGVMVVAFVVLLWIIARIGLFGFFGGIVNNIWEKATYHAGFRLQYVYLNYANQLDNSEVLIQSDAAKAEILKTMGIEGQEIPNIALMSLSPQEIQKNIEALSWVHNATVKMVYPDTIHLNVKQREPFVVLEGENQTTVFDSQGVALPIHPDATPEGLLRITGDGAFEAAVDLLNIVADTPDLFGEIQLAKRVSKERRWDIYLKNGVLVKMPAEYDAQAWQEMARLAQGSNIAQHVDSTTRAVEVKVVDLRVPDRVTLQTG